MTIDVNEPVKDSLTVFIHILHTFSPHSHLFKKINNLNEWARAPNDICHIWILLIKSDIDSLR